MTTPDINAVSDVLADKGQSLAPIVRFAASLHRGIRPILAQRVCRLSIHGVRVVVGTFDEFGRRYDVTVFPSDVADVLPSIGAAIHRLRQNAYVLRPSLLQLRKLQLARVEALNVDVDRLMTLLRRDPSDWTLEEKRTLDDASQAVGVESLTPDTAALVGICVAAQKRLSVAR